MLAGDGGCGHRPRWAEQRPYRQTNITHSFESATVSVLHPDKTPGDYGLDYHKAGFSFELAYAAIDRGSFTIEGCAVPGNIGFRGDVADLVKSTGPKAAFSPATSRGGLGGLNTGLTFDACGDVLSGTMYHRSDNGILAFNISNTFVEGVWEAEHPACWYGREQTGASTIKNVLEPASMASLGMGLTGVWFARRRRV